MAQENNYEHFTYEKDLWNKLDLIIGQAKKGQSHLHGLDKFTRNYFQVLKSFSGGLKKTVELFEKDMNKEQGFDTTAISVCNIKKGVVDIADIIDKKAQIILNDIIEPLEQYNKHHSAAIQKYVTEAKTYWKAHEEDKLRLTESQTKYYQQMREAENCELNIEKDLLMFERGQIS
jgi:hypothetical protein